MIIKIYKAPEGVTFSRSTIKMLNKTRSMATMISFFKGRNYEFKIFKEKDLTLIQKLKIFFAKKELIYDPFDNANYDQITEKMQVLRPEEMMSVYYEEYYDTWGKTMASLDSKNPKFVFKNFSKREIRHFPIEAEGFEYHYPFEMYALPEEDPGYDEDIDSVQTDPYTDLRLKLPLTTLRWNYYMSSFEEKTEDVFMVSWALMNDLEENNDLITAALETLYDPEFRHSEEFNEFFNFIKIRYEISLYFYVDNNNMLSITLFMLPWFFSFLGGDLLTHEFNHSSVILCDIQTVFLYIFAGHELVWKIEGKTTDFLMTIWKEYHYHYFRKFKKCSSTFKKDILKVWRLVNLKKLEPKMYKKLKQYYTLVLLRKINFALLACRTKAVRDKQHFRISLFNSVSLLRFLIWCSRKLSVFLSAKYNGTIDFLKNLIPNTINFIINFFKSLYSNILFYLKLVFKFFTSKEDNEKISRSIINYFKRTSEGWVKLYEFLTK